jgi:hypothetical protein
MLFGRGFEMEKTNGITSITQNTFFKAALLTTVVFLIGIFVGVWLDTLRLEDVQTALEEINDRWYDARMQSLYFQTFEKTPGFCNAAIDANLEFNEKIYEEGLKIERYEEVNKFTPSLLNEKKRYALLQLQFWMNSIQLRDSCNTNYTTLVYFYSNDEKLTIDQNLQSAVLMDIKSKCGTQLMLIPLPADLDIETIGMITSHFGVDKFPAVLINETITLKGLQSEKDLSTFIPCLQSAA